MPVSKRDRVVHTSKVKKNGKSDKADQIEQIRDSVAQMRYTYVVSVSNDRNIILKSIRDELKPGKMFCSKNKIGQVALGFTPQTACAEGIHPLSALISGLSALITSNLEAAQLVTLLKTQ